MVVCSPPQPMWDITIHPSSGPSVLAGTRSFIQSMCSLGFPFRASPQGFKTRLLGEGFHTLINGGLFSSLTNVGHHNPPPFGAQRPHWHSFLPPIDVGSPPNPPPLGPSALTGTPSRVYPLRETARRLAHRSVFGSDTSCNAPNFL